VLVRVRILGKDYQAKATAGRLYLQDCCDVIVTTSPKEELYVLDGEQELGPRDADDLGVELVAATAAEQAELARGGYRR
jgi:hypothetical protein